MEVRLIPLVVSVALAASCGGPTLHRVDGVLRETGGPQGASQPGVRGQVVFSTGDKTTTVQTDTYGRFRVTLAPGRYLVTGSSPQYGSGEGICRTFEPVVLTSSALSGVVVACDRK